ncbi:Aristolochene synthase in complex with 12,13 Difluorofarnesyl diphosphate [Xylariaceae sp. AK1471]|nr:Aristolochene synthase in complex with 12,13 Difluorofarnesyl diphosphate [Xylariaceae sp. AK1471]
MIRPTTAGVAPITHSPSAATARKCKNTVPFIKRHIPVSGLSAFCHPLTERTIKEVNDFYLQNWEFTDPKVRKRFEGEGYVRVTCFYLCKSRDDRIALACRLVTLLFLIDDILEHLSLEEGMAYIDKMFAFFRGEVQLDRNLPAEWISYDLWEELRACDRKLADQLLEPIYAFMKSQTDPRHLVGWALVSIFNIEKSRSAKGEVLSALIGFTSGLHLSAEDLAIADEADRNCGRHMAVINDIWSYEKEVHASKTLHEEGGILCNAVAILADDTKISTDSAKRVLYQLAREMEIEQECLVREVLSQKDTPEMRAYLEGIEYQMSGNEFWSRSTDRYLAPVEL